jgi:hypothetical protein
MSSKRTANNGAAADAAELGETTSLLIDSAPLDDDTTTVEQHSVMYDVRDTIMLGVPIFISMLSYVGVSNYIHIFIMFLGMKCTILTEIARPAGAFR